ncbi:MAG: ABC transporter permease [Bacteroidota bacterium]
MIKLVIKRTFNGLLIIYGVITVVFFLFNILPADPGRLMLGQRSDVASLEAINKQLGLDLPVSKRYVFYLNDISPLSVYHLTDSTSRVYASHEKYGSFIVLMPLGGKSIILKKPYLNRSYQSQELVSVILLDALPGTIVLSVVALLIAAIVGIVLGVWSATRYQQWPDYLNLFLSILGMSVPSFFAGILVAWVFGFVLSNYTGLSMTGSLYEIDPFMGEVLNLKNIVLPAFTLGIRPLAVFVQLTRSSMLDAINTDYVRTAKAKGLSYKTILFKHALRNALNPVITAISGWFGSLLAGAVFIEYIFGWKGVGKVTVDALEHYDFPVVMGAVMMVSVFFVIINWMVDLLYAVLDPRVRVE